MEKLLAIWRFYRNGFRDLTPLGRTLWLLIIVKLFIMFVVLRLFFFRPVLSDMSPAEKQEHVATELIPNNPK